MLISTQSLTVHHGAHRVLDHITFCAHTGEFVCIVGTSGSGKSTFLHALAGFTPYSGMINKPSQVGIVFQHHAVFPWLTVEQNIACGIDKSLPAEARRNSLAVHLQLAGLEQKGSAYPAELSGGQVQRVALARTLAHNPDVLLMDEPYSSLDEYTRERMQSWLLDVWSSYRKTIIFVTHSIEEALFLADRVLVLEEGKFTKEYIVPFSRPRTNETKFSPEFNRLRKKIYESLTSSVSALPQF